MEPTNYFTCTLGEAVPLNKSNPPPWQTIPELLEHQAEHNGNTPAVGLPCAPTAGQDGWEAKIYSRLLQNCLVSALTWL